MRLSDLITSTETLSFDGDDSIEIAGIAFDSKRVKPGWLFVAIKGDRYDGHDFLAEALERGAAAVVVEREPAVRDLPGPPALLLVADSRRALSHMAAAWYRRPFEGMNILAVTGTNGKTTTSYLLEAVLNAAGRRVGVIGTVNWRVGDEIHRTVTTTPEPLELMNILGVMAAGGASDVVMEVSSHALVQRRVCAIPFSTALFTNLSRDHLDYHGTMENYLNAKSVLFEDLDENAVAVINGDDPAGKTLSERTPAKVVTYGLGDKCRVRAVDTRLSTAGLSATVDTPAGEMKINSRLVGAFNIYNILAAVAACLESGVAPGSIISGIASLSGVPGRLEMVPNSRSVAVLVDYAHTPDALLKAGEAVKHMVSGRFITVFGCGGDRDPGKRSEMGRIAAEMSDLVFITSDNPRGEDPSAITGQIEEGAAAAGMRPVSNRAAASGSGYIVEPDREAAIKAAIRAARPGDLILIAGKGHENYQETLGVRRPFDDRLVAARAAEEAGS